MKDTHFLYSAAILAIGSILAIFASYATDRLPRLCRHIPINVGAVIEYGE